MKKYGLNGENIVFTPTCVEKIKKYDFIEFVNDGSLPNLFCKEKDVFVIVTDDPCNIYLTEEDLTKTFRIRKLEPAPHATFSYEIPEGSTKEEVRQIALKALKSHYKKE